MKSNALKNDNTLNEVLNEQNFLIILTMNSQGVINSVNKVCTAITGYDIEEITGSNFAEFFLPGELKYQWENLINKIVIGDVNNYQLTIKHKNADYIYLLVNTVNSYDENSELEEVRLYAVDVTGYKESHSKEEELFHELRVRNEELDSFAHTVAHDLKNPLGVLMGFTDILFKEFENLTSDQLHEVLKSITKTGFKMRSIIKELLLLTEVRRGDVEFEPVNMKKSVKDALSRIEDMTERSKAEIIVAEDLPNAMGYATWIEEIWVNYLSNAVKHGALPPKVEIGYEKLENNRVKYWVKDNGKGIDEEEQKKLFVPFTRLQVIRAEGHGLGLSVVKTIIDRLNGEVGIESTVSKGSKFYFILNLIS